MKQLVGVLLAVLISACASNQASVYQQLGGEAKVAEIVDNFILEIGMDPIMLCYFEDSNIDRFRDKMQEHLCMLTGGGCTYTGDTMEQVHGGMKITEAHFNHGVDLFIRAMDKAGVPHRLQNQVLAQMAPTREDMIYR
ncbi:group 1 truncated hemoglobin [Aestuariibacter halophilus]|uniref:Group 1 truncated hemoglobin n=1 Tax=Fluctibacter halophilus TaxID=226011 RepID=A0ABS8GCR8_9ALTE|nr:group 1 truncated hemoglobin [Aestuariibacter halophilus]MCC2617589.1 group 1 truncated hemoglobin [Aestuariibacter halophilus]